MTRVSESRAEVAARELLAIRGWDVARPPKGNVYWKNEYRENPTLLDALGKASKSGDGAGYPDFIVVDRHSLPVIVGETKADQHDIGKASEEARQYARELSKHGLSVLAAGVAGDQDDHVEVRVHKQHNSRWRQVVYRNEPIQWLPAPDEAANLLLNPDLFTLDPEVPPPEVLAEKAKEINRILRECRIKDEYRPAAVAAFMLALWKTKGDLRNHPEHILGDVNSACKRAFRDANKSEIEDSITVDAANEALSNEAHRIVRTLRLLNVSTLTSAHDYLGQLYEYFFRFTGANTIGQFFTPRHITHFMADVCEVGPRDFVVDPACGTGGFLIASLYRMIGNRRLSLDQIRKLVSDHLWGFESEPVTAALCVANMILRGDGTSGIVKGNCFTDHRYPIGQADVVLGNPPFPHKKSDEQPEKFIDRALEALRQHGITSMVVPSSMLVKTGAKQTWRRDTLRENTLRAVVTLPDELFEPFASACTSILLMEKGRPHTADDQVFFARVENDGFRLKKKVRVVRDGEQLSETRAAYQRHQSKPGQYGWSDLHSTDWSPGEYIESAPAGDREIKAEVERMLRSNAALHATYADSLLAFRRGVESGRFLSRRYSAMTKRKAFTRDDGPTRLGAHFLIYYGQKELHSKEWLEPGDALIISSAGENNGCYGFFDFENLIRPPFATVPSTGSIGAAFVQHLPCGVTDDCLILVPKEGTPPEMLYVAAAVVRLERWRFSYGRKITPKRISGFKIPRKRSLLRWISQRWQRTERLSRQIVESFDGDSGAQSQFAELAADWRDGRPRGHDVEAMSAHQSYQRIIGMGERALPFILADLKNKPDHWFWALHAITGQDPVPEGSRGKLTKMTEAWLEWGRSRGYVW